MYSLRLLAFHFIWQLLTTAKLMETTPKPLELRVGPVLKTARLQTWTLMWVPVPPLHPWAYDLLKPVPSTTGESGKNRLLSR